MRAQRSDLAVSKAITWPAKIGTAEKFLRNHWQQQSVFLPQAFTFEPPLDANDIAGLATLDNVESTLVTTRHDQHQTMYEVTHGPFTDEQLTALGERDWTLLVHDVDAHVPVTAQLFATLDFLPRWRIDNLMVSVAAPGGSVGAHADSYDVMLLQGDGERNWQLAPADAGNAVPDHPLRLRADVAFDDQHHARCGDIVYVPPGVIHHGTATTLCTTWSLGMQAPLLSDIAALADGTLDPKTTLQTRYTDQHWQPRKAGQILPADVASLPIRHAPVSSLITALGILVTQCKPHLRNAAVRAQTDMQLSAGSRIAWAMLEEQLQVFANGQVTQTHTDHCPAIVALVSTGIWSHTATHEMTHWLAGCGALEPRDDEEGLP